MRAASGNPVRGLAPIGDAQSVEVQILAHDAASIKRRQLYFHLLVVDCNEGDDPFAMDPFVGNQRAVEFRLPTSGSITQVTGSLPSEIFKSYEHPCAMLEGGYLTGTERVAKTLLPLSTFGAAPMFFYLLHLYVLRLLYVCAHAIWGNNQGSSLGVDDMAGVWAISLLLGLVLWWPTRAFAQLKARRRDWIWLRYF